MFLAELQHIAQIFIFFSSSALTNFAIFPGLQEVYSASDSVVFYFKGVEDLARTLKGIKFSRILCAYEIRDIGEPKTAQRIFFDLIQNEYIVEEIKKDELDPVYCHPDIKIFYLIRKS